jgi:anti-anti-sigma factor
VAHTAPRRPAPGLDWESSGTRAVVLVRGELGAQLETFLSGRSLAGCRDLELDLAGVPSIGSAGLSALLGVHRWALQRGVTLRLSEVQPSVWRVIEPAGLGPLFAGAAEPMGAPVQELALF